MKASSTKRQRGFTLVEMLVVVGIMGILAAIAAPNMTLMIRTQRVKNAAFDIFSAMNLARSEALKRNRTIRIQPNGGNWANGWIASDSAGNVVQTQGGWDSLTLSGPSSIQFTPAGRSATGLQQFTLTAANLASGAQRCITLDASGRATSKDGAC
jgi:type IV fimbrial biogenesis protein FimT